MLYCNSAAVLTKALSKHPDNSPEFRAKALGWFNEVVRDILNQPREWAYLAAEHTIAVVNTTFSSPNASGGTTTVNLKSLVTLPNGAGELISVKFGDKYLPLLSDVEALPANTELYGYTLSNANILTLYGTMDLSASDYTPTDDRYSFSRASTATYVDFDGIVQTAAVDELRWDYSGGTFNGILLESAATNQLLHSANFGNAVWTTTSFNGTGIAPVITPNFAISPAGTTTACRIVCDSGAGGEIGDYSVMRQTAPVAGTHGQVWIKSNTENDQILHVNADTGVRITATTSWSLVSWATASSRAFDIGAWPRNGSEEVVDVLIWGPQLDSYDGVNSTIITADTAVTRAADVITTQVTVEYNPDITADYTDSATDTIFPLPFENLLVIGTRVHIYDYDKDGRYGKEEAKYAIAMNQMKALDNRRKAADRTDRHGYTRVPWNGHK